MNKMSRAEQWRAEFGRHKYLIILSFVFLAASLVLNYVAGDFVNEAITTPVPDMILGHIPTINLSFIFLYGYAAVIGVLLLYPLFYKVHEFHIALSQFSLLILVRSFFIILTHLGAPPGAILPNMPRLYNLLIFQNDLFFSAHTAVPFLGYLLYRKEKIGKFFLGATIVLAATVLLMHVHYSIDVFAALFIAFGSYKFGEWFFRRINYY